MSKIGDTWYAVNVVDDTGTIEWDVYTIRTIRGGYVYATARNKWTWGKRSTRNGDFGWLDPIDPLWRVKWRIGAEPSSYHCMARSRKAAIKLQIASLKAYGDDDNYKEPGTLAKVIKTLGTMLKRQK